jgi:hypothetical protein
MAKQSCLRLLLFFITSLLYNPGVTQMAPAASYRSPILAAIDQQTLSGDIHRQCTFRYEEISENQILDEVNRLKKERGEVGEILSHSEQSLVEQNDMNKVEIELRKVSLETPEEIENYTLTDKKHALNAFKIQNNSLPESPS